MSSKAPHEQMRNHPFAEPMEQRHIEREEEMEQYNERALDVDNDQNNYTDQRVNDNCKVRVRATNEAGSNKKHKSVLEKILYPIIQLFHFIVPTGGVLSGAFNMASVCIGAGILGLPSATDSSGLLLSIILEIIFMLLAIFSMHILALAVQNSRIKSFEGMARWLFPYYHYAFSYWAAFVRWFNGFSSATAYVISIGDCFTTIISSAAENHPDSSSLKYFSSRSGGRVLTVIVWLFVMFPLVVPKHVDSLRIASMFAVAFMVFFSIVIVVHSCLNGLLVNKDFVKLNDKHFATDAPNTVYLFRTGNAIVPSVGVFMFAFVCQMNALEIFWDMRPEIRTTTNYTWSAIIGELICYTLYQSVSIFGYFDFGSKNLSGKSILKMYKPLKDIYVLVAYVGVMIKLCVAYALQSNGARNSIYYMIGWQAKYSPKSEKFVSNTDVINPLNIKNTDTSFSNSSIVKPKSRQVRQNDDTNCAQHEANNAPFPINCSREVTNDLLVDVDAEPSEELIEDNTVYLDYIPFWQHLIVVVTLSVAALLCGLFIPNINTVFGFGGAICGGFLSCICPALFFMYSGGFCVERVGWFKYLFTYLLLMIGVAGVIFGTGGTIYSVVTS